MTIAIISSLTIRDQIRNQNQHRSNKSNSSLFLQESGMLQSLEKMEKVDDIFILIQ